MANLLVRHLESEPTHADQTETSHPFRDLVLEVSNRLKHGSIYILREAFNHLDRLVTQ
jgi:hypothetical protein